MLKKGFPMANLALRGDFPGCRAFGLPGLSPVQTPHSPACYCDPCPASEAMLQIETKMKLVVMLVLLQFCLTSVLLLKILLQLHATNHREVFGKRTPAVLELQIAHTMLPKLIQNSALLNSDRQYN